MRLNKVDLVNQLQYKFIKVQILGNDFPLITFLRQNLLENRYKGTHSLGHLGNASVFTLPGTVSTLVPLHMHFLGLGNFCSYFKTLVGVISSRKPSLTS